MTTVLPPIPDWLDVPAGERALAMALQFQLQQTQHASPAAVADLQLRMLQRVVAHAVAHTPYYRERLGKDFRLASWQQWQQVPILTRADIQAAGNRMRSAQLPKEQGPTRVIRSSGSTGRPVEVLSTQRAAVIHRAITHRDHLWHRRQLGGRLAVIRFDGSRNTDLPGKQREDWGDGSKAMFPNGPGFALNSNTPAEKQLQWLLDIRADHLLTYPSLVLELARINDAAGRPLRLRGLSTLGEMLLPHQRAAGEESFGCRLADMYSSQEVGYIALQCPRHAHYHVQSENCLVEILDADGKPCAPGTAGRVVVTPLHSLAQPLLRYEIGDHAIPGPTCDCGIRLPVIERILGRTRNLVVLPDGSRAWPAYNPMKLMELFPGAQFQVVQETRSDVVLRVCGAGDIAPATAQAAVAIVRNALGPFNILVESVDGIARGANGKYEEFLCRLPAGA